METFVSKDYSREDFAEFLRGFLPDDFEPREEETYFDFKNIERGYRLGECKSLDLDIFEFRTKSDHDPRVTLTREVVSCMKKHGYSPNALAVFHSERSHGWRLSLITTDYSIEDGKVKTEHSNPRRFSFLLGAGCKAHTPETMLLNRGTVSSRDDLKSRFDIEVVTKEFYSNLFSWYTWACEKASFPTGSTEKDAEGKRGVQRTDKNNSLNLIRLITRLMFVWFIKQKNLIPSWIFDKEELGKILSEFKPESEKDGNYYNAVLQNLFFATLNKKIDERAFADDKKVSHNNQFGVKNLYRDNKQKSFFKKSNKEILDLFKPVPFLNGGLFECLDKLKDGKDGKKNIQEFTDGFTREPDWMAHVPNMLFWQEDDGEHEGLIHILNRYNFTVDENSPTDVQVALDPELLGKVFENLLGTYNPETSETARKSSGSFYTPRQIVSFMVDEAIKAYLSKAVKSISAEELETLFDDGIDDFDAANKEEIVSALKKLKILDPACGSGAFPMGALQRLVHLIGKCGGISGDRESLYALKLELIEKCLYGVDIQPIAVQICKLRFFISLICEQEKNDSVQDNYGFNPLPNLETKFVAANSLIGISKRKEYETGELFANPEIALTKEKLQKERHNHFNAPSAEAKAECRKNDKLLREKLSKLLQEDNMYDNREAKLLAGWNPYDQNTASDFFDAEWMFNVSGGFDIVIGNPPYISAPTQIANKRLAEQRERLVRSKRYKSLYQKWDLYVPFIELGIQLNTPGGITAMIVPFPLTNQLYAKKIRRLLVEEADLFELVDLNGTKIFENATVSNCIPFIRKSASGGKTWISNIDEKLEIHRVFEQGHADLVQDARTFVWNVTKEKRKANRHAEMNVLGDYCYVSYGLRPNSDEKIAKGEFKKEDLISDIQDKVQRRKYIEGKDIERYSVKRIRYLEYGTRRSPAKLVRPTFKEWFDIPKIMFSKFGGLSGILNNAEYLLHNDTVIGAGLWKDLHGVENKSIASSIKKFSTHTRAEMEMLSAAVDLRYLLGIMNSRYAAVLLANIRGDDFNTYPEYIRNIPIPPATAAQQKPVIALVDKILAAKKQDPAADTSALETQIDDLVYALYGLTPEEIAVVEGR